uniref:Protein kinase C-terminal domain-containing protein n=1 Tax=Canis lupus dingo TaxID=286419 RepID=A0A8C0LN77_CANLU
KEKKVKIQTQTGRKYLQMDVSQFHSKFTHQTPVDSPDDSTLSESANQVFRGFTYIFKKINQWCK